jgi:hypothetical protein
MSRCSSRASTVLTDSVVLFNAGRHGSLSGKHRSELTCEFWRCVTPSMAAPVNLPRFIRTCSGMLACGRLSAKRRASRWLSGRLDGHDSSRRT